MDIRVATHDELLQHSPALRSVYSEAFCAPPWNEDEERADAFVVQLSPDVRRPGFTAALAFDGADLVGFATSWATPTPFPSDRCHPQAAASLGPGRTEEWLCGAREVDELAVRPTARGTGLAAGLLRAVTEGAPAGRAWLLTSLRSPL
ncbi:GNAT family N-acetyltransferase, partial [Streptomyces misionensis]